MHPRITEHAHTYTEKYSCIDYIFFTIFEWVKQHLIVT